MRRSTEMILAALAIVLVAFVIGWLEMGDAAKSERDVAYKLANQYRWQRDSTAKAQAKTDTITRRVIVQDRRLLAERDSLMAVLTYADSVFADSAATIADLRATRAIERARVAGYLAEVDSLQAYTRELIAAHAEERFRTNRTLAAADSTITAWQGVAHAERRKGWRRFTQGAFVGGIAAVVLVVVL